MNKLLINSHINKRPESPLKRILLLTLAILSLQTSLFAQVFVGSARALGNPQSVQTFFDSAAFFLIKTVGMVVGMIALSISIFAAKFGRGSFGNISSVCLYIGLLFLSPSIVQLLALFAGVGIF